MELSLFHSAIAGELKQTSKANQRILLPTIHVKFPMIAAVVQVIYKQKYTGSKGLPNINVVA